MNFRHGDDGSAISGTKTVLLPMWIYCPILSISCASFQLPVAVDPEQKATRETVQDNPLSATVNSGGGYATIGKKPCNDSRASFHPSCCHKIGARYFLLRGMLRLENSRTLFFRLIHGGNLNIWQAVFSIDG